MTKPTDPFPPSPSVITTPTQSLIDALRFATVSGASVVGIADTIRQGEITSIISSINHVVDPKELADMRQVLTQVRPTEARNSHAPLPPKPPSDRSIS
jgi:hypothetical protein